MYAFDRQSYIFEQHPELLQAANPMSFPYFNRSINDTSYFLSIGSKAAGGSPNSPNNPDNPNNPRSPGNPGNPNKYMCYVIYQYICIIIRMVGPISFKGKNIGFFYLQV